MGSPGSERRLRTLLHLTSHLLLLLIPARGQRFTTTENVSQSPNRIHSSYEFVLREIPLINSNDSRNIKSPWSLPANALNISFIRENNRLCIQISVSFNPSDLPVHYGFTISYLEFTVSAKKTLKEKFLPGDLRGVRYHCWHIAQDVQDVTVSLLAILKRGTSANRDRHIANSYKGVPDLYGFYINLLEISAKRLTKRHTENASLGDLWKVRHRCQTARPALGRISVSLLNIPEYGICMGEDTHAPNTFEIPSDFYFQLFPKRRRIVLSTSDNHTAYTRLCHMSSVCEDLGLEATAKKLLRSSKNTSLSYDTLLPCLCIEVFYYIDPRMQVCPFIDQPEPYAMNLMSVSAQCFMNGTRSMRMMYDCPCKSVPAVSLCRKQRGGCVTVPDATILEEASEDGMAYYIDDIDIDPHLCFKFALWNSTYIRCPEHRDRKWKVDVEQNLLSVVLKISSATPASFSAVVCRRNQTTDFCSVESPVHTFSLPHQRCKQRCKQLQLSLPWPRPDRCIMVWRSDVRFAHKYFICSFDYSHKHLGLVTLLALMVTFSLTLLFFLAFHRIWKILTAPLWQRTILLVYSPDSTEYKTLICAFADFLQSILGCEVILDMWDTNTVRQIGMIPWFYQKRELVSQKKGKVMIVWTTRTKSMYQQWKNHRLNSFVWKDPTNLFGIAMSCLHKDLESEQENIMQKEYTLVYFDGLCDRADIPKVLRKISRYRLFKDLYRLVCRLQDTTWLSPPCLIKAVAKYFMKKLIRSEKSQGLQHHVELCKQKLHQELNFEIVKMESTSL
ncbi:interleukin-17 receptor E-like [Hyperolius riggenbachi]|uniref:interleukin-17 receptor E-like n=1 Tax=Hyperolius riggenbachi TaxID=752182 RepID=UPI0035A2A6B0